jgi:protocatechuate 3,4-dioxygenase beta subunit
MKSACLGVVLATCCFAQPLAVVEKAVVSGTVTNAAGAPLRGVTLQLAPLRPGQISLSLMAGSAPNAAAETDSQGNFTFDGVAPGRYLLSAERGGYLNTFYTSGRGGVLNVTPGQKATGIAIKMTPQGIIAGRVVDEENEPVSAATVAVHSYPPRGQEARGEVPLIADTTNADGAFAVGNLAPGRYTLSVTTTPRGVPFARSAAPGRPQEAYVPTYYPDATDAAGATPIELGAGEQARGLEIRIRKVPVFRVSGNVVNAATREAGSGGVLNMIRRNSGSPVLSTRSTGINAGAFSFDGVLPGTYVLETTSAGEDGPRLVGRQVISVGNGDLDRVVVEMKPGIAVRGTIVLEGATLTTWPQIALTPTEGVDYPSDFVTIDENGRFAVAGLEPAPYRVNVGALPRPNFIKAMRFNGRDIHVDTVGEPIDLGLAPSGSLEIVISSGTGSISGMVSDSGGAVGAAITVLAHSGGSPGVTRMAQTDENGRFSLAGLPPGEYKLVAVDIGIWIGQPPPEIMEKLGTVVSVGEGASATAELRLITTEDVRVTLRNP